MCNTGKGTITRDKRGTYQLYISAKLVDDSMFPLKCNHSLPVTISFVPNQTSITIEKAKEST
jgi:hypothetical protein